MNNWTKEIKDFFESSFEFTKGYTLIEVIFIVLLGVASSQVKEFISPWSLLIFASGVVLFITYSQRNKFLNKFPKSLIDSVEQNLNLKDVEIQRKESEIERIKVEKRKGRSGLINDAISKTIVGLNNQTCTLSAKEDPLEEITSKLCDKDVEDGLIQILTPFLTEIYTIIEDEDSQVLVGVYFNDIAQDRGGNKSLPPSYPYYITVKDDIGLKNKIPSTIVEDNTLTADLQLLQQTFEICLRNNRFVQQELNLFQEKFQVVISPIPYACNEDDASGATMIIVKNASFPKDFEKIIRIFNRLLTNWMYKYNNCVYGRGLDVWHEFHDENENFIQLFHNGRYKFINAKKY